MNGLSVWDGDWAWSLPLIMLTVIFHVVGLGLFNARLIELEDLLKKRREYDILFALVMGVTTLWTTLLLAVEAGVWAIAYRMLGALPGGKLAMLYSLSAITTYGHSEVYLADRWRLMGALEALNGIMLFGLTTAFMYGMIQRVWPVERRHGYKPTLH